MKWCGKCKDYKREEDFYRDKQGRPIDTCKECRRAYQRRYHREKTGFIRDLDDPVRVRELDAPHKRQGYTADEVREWLEKLATGPEPPQVKGKGQSS